jgi:hypothetical protein
VEVEVGKEQQQAVNQNTLAKRAVRVVVLFVPRQVELV